MLRSRKGFTLIELIIVVIIVGILAAIAAPMMTGNVNKAKRSEAIAALGSLRTCAKLYQAEANGTLPAWGNLVPTYMASGDLNGMYYNYANYSVSGATISVDAGTNGAGAANININTGALNQ